MDFNMAGPALALGLSAIGSAVGCGVSGMASHAVMARVDDGHGKFIGMSAMPATMLIYGFILMLLMKGGIEQGSVSALSGVFIGLSSGSAIMIAAIYQGLCAVSGIQATARNPSVFGKCFAALGIVESFALFAFVFALLLL